MLSCWLPISHVCRFMMWQRRKVSYCEYRAWEITAAAIPGTHCEERDSPSSTAIIDSLKVLADKESANLEPAWFDEGENIRLADEIVVDLIFNLNPWVQGG